MSTDAAPAAVRTTIPEILGAARAWEVTGNDRWRAIVEAYWHQAVTARGYFATGGQTCGEIWTPPHEQAARLGDKNQEHCTVYNMMRVADYLLRWTGEAAINRVYAAGITSGCGPARYCPTELVTRGQMAAFLQRAFD